MLFAYLIGLITNYINNLNLTAALFRDKLARLRNFMEYRQLSPEVQTRIADRYSGRLWLSTGGTEEKTASAGGVRTQPLRPNTRAFHAGLVW